MKIKVKELETWKNWIDALSKLISDLKLMVSKDGIIQRRQAQGATYLIEFSFDKEYFEEYDIDQQRVIALDVAKFNEVLQKGKKNDTLILTIEQEGELTIVFSGDVIRSYTLPMLSTTQKDVQKPDLVFDTEFSIKAGELKEEVQNVKLVSQQLLLKSSDDSIEFLSSGGGQGSYRSIREEEDLESLSVKKSSEAIYQWDVIEKLLTSLDKEEELSVHYSTDLPILIETGDKNKSLEFLRAPVVKRD